MASLASDLVVGAAPSTPVRAGSGSCPHIDLTLPLGPREGGATRLLLPVSDGFSGLRSSGRGSPFDSAQGRLGELSPHRPYLAAWPPGRRRYSSTSSGFGWLLWPLCLRCGGVRFRVYPRAVCLWPGPVRPLLCRS